MVVPEVPEAFFVLRPGAVEADGAIESLLYHSPAASVGLHVTKHLKSPITGIWGDAIHSILFRLKHIVVRTVSRGDHVCKKIISNRNLVQCLQSVLPHVFRLFDIVSQDNQLISLRMQKSSKCSSVCQKKV